MPNFIQQTLLLSEKFKDYIIEYEFASFHISFFALINVSDKIILTLIYSHTYKTDVLSPPNKTRKDSVGKVPIIFLKEYLFNLNGKDNWKGWSLKKYIILENRLMCCF